MTVSRIFRNVPYANRRALMPANGSRRMNTAPKMSGIGDKQTRSRLQIDANDPEAT
jgi:hypothetical protein